MDDVNATIWPREVTVKGGLTTFYSITFERSFRDGNGRISRLLTVLALYHHGFEVGRYISLERLIEESKEDYYAVLQASSTGWHDGKHDLLPWLNSARRRSPR